MTDHTMRQKLEQHLASIANASPEGAGCFVEQRGNTRLRARLRSVDRLACETELISVDSSTLAQATPDQLRELADQLAESLCYLEEQLVVLEVDRQTPEVQMRSQTPRHEGDACCYFEVRVSRQGIALRRFQKVNGQPRSPVAAVFTRDTFCRVCADLFAASGPQG